MGLEDLIVISWEECPECGMDVGFAEHDIAGEHADEQVYDGATAYCTQCGKQGVMSVDDDCSFINWD